MPIAQMGTHTCNMCGKDGLHWENNPKGRPTLANSDGTWHHKFRDYDGKVIGCSGNGEGPSDSKGLELNPNVIPAIGPVSNAEVDKAKELAQTSMNLTLQALEQFSKIGAEFIDMKQEFGNLDSKWQGILQSKQEIVLKNPETGDMIDVGLQHKQFVKLVKVAKSLRGKAVPFLFGEPGSMKTSVLSAFAKAVGTPDRFWVVSMNNQTSRSELLGYKNGSGEYVPSPAYWAAKDGGVVLYDEIDASNANGLTGLNTLATNEFIGFPNGEVVRKHKDCYMLAAGNTIGAGANPMFIGRNQLDMASRTRFVYIRWDTDWDLVANIVRGITGSFSWAVKTRMLHDIVESKRIQFVVTSRVAIAGAQMIMDGFSEDDVLDMMVWPNLSDDDKRVVELLYQEAKAGA